MQKSVIERAFELARSGEYVMVSDIVRKLYQEQHELVSQHLGGRLIIRQLKVIIAGSRAGAPAPINEASR